MEILKTLFKSEEFFLIFLDCLQEAEKCCFEDMTIENIFPSEQECSVVWDAWSCFPRTPVNTTKKLVCSKQAYSSLTDYCTLESEKVCFFNETTGKAQWIEQTDYNNCAIAPVYKRRHKYNVITLHICNVVDVPAILIFLLYRKLRQSTRMSLHRNLLIAIVIRNVLTIMTKELIIIDQLNVNTKNVMGENGVPCRVLAFFENVFKNAIFACMVIDGYYLHKQIVRNHAPEPKKLTLSLVSVVLSLVPSLIWATLKGVNEGGYCWMVDSNNEQWTGDGFRILVLIINILILVDIIRIIFTRMRHGGTSRQTKAALKSTLFLIPLFGLQFLVTAKKMVLNDTCVAEDAYEYTKYSMEAFQGIMVAILFCYASSEVHVEINNTYRKVRIFLEDRFGIAYNKGNIDRRATTATFVGN
ncbi:calcitonin receptor-like [Aethina tumida]|uniref:calcitonin receptor-like n=1 Tax=Aethina tumida TaxID=116153 RepID=UPI0021489D3D|nr:calcitonin receptor-like [Aethina tumida]